MKKTKEEKLAHLQKCELEVDENPGVDSVAITEIANNNGFILYEYNKEDNIFIDDFSVDEETIHEFFPDVILEESKGYVIEKDDALYVG